MTYLIFSSAFLATIILTLLVRRLAWRFDIVDKAAGQERKIHRGAIPLLGGLAIFISYFLFLLVFNNYFRHGELGWSQLLGFLAGAILIMIGGFLDDRYNLPPRAQVVFPILAALAAIAGGIGIAKISSPFGGIIDLGATAWVGPLLVFFWLLGLMYTTKLLDGVDGLVSGLSVIGGLVIFLFTLTTRYYQPNIAFAAGLLAAVSLGFLVLNWHPAKIFLGEGGSLLLGYILGVLAVISGGKIAIALLVMGIPIMDVVWTILRRSLAGRNPFRSADRKHLHHRLLSLGLGQRRTVLIFYALSLIFGLSGLFLQSRGKFWALIVLLFIMLGIVIIFSWREKRSQG